MEKASKNPLISVIVPIYNVEEYLNRCVDSIINQTYKNLEIILVDDGSPDNCPSICDYYVKKDKRIKVIHKENGGLSDARNVGIDKSKGKYLTFIDSDDYIENNYIETLYYLIQKYNSKISMVDIKTIHDSGKVYSISDNKEYVYTQKVFFEKMLYGFRDLDNSASAKLYQKDLFKNIRYPIGRFYEDTATTYKIIFKCEIIPIKSISLYNYMIRNNSIVQRKFNTNKLQLIDSTKQMVNSILIKYPELKDACLRKEAWSYLSTLSQMANSNYYDKKIVNYLKEFIINNKKVLLSNKKIKLYDKCGVISICIGYRFYKTIWNFYTKIMH